MNRKASLRSLTSPLAAGLERSTLSEEGANLSTFSKLCLADSRQLLDSLFWKISPPTA